MTDAAATLEEDAARVVEALQPRRRARPRLAEPLREAEDREIDTPFGKVTAWRLSPWGAPATAPAVLLIHGWEDDNALWGPMIDACQEIGRPIVAFDLPGHGFSQAEGCSIGRAAAAARAVAETMGPIDGVIAHSFGCPVTARALADGLAAKRVVLIATPLPVFAGHRKAYDRVQEALGVSDAVIEQAMAINIEREAIFPPFDYRGLAAAMTAKAMFIHSIDDEDCEPENSRALADAWPGAGLTWVEGLGHRRIAQDAAVIQQALAFIDA